MMITEGYSERIDKAVRAIQKADFVLIGAGAGLSAAAGMEYSGKRFTDNFKEFIEMYAMKDLYSSSFYPFKTREGKWAYWAKHISLNRYETPAMELYIQLFEFVRPKMHFVITTNVESQFEKAGFDKSGIFEVQGNYALLQCATACHDTLYNNEGIITRMLRHITHCRIPESLVPKCPVCGGEMDVNLRKDGNFVQDWHWYESERRYSNFIRNSTRGKLVLLELGVGYNTPGIIRYPFESIVNQYPHATLIRINRDDPFGFEENIKSTITFDEDIRQVISDFCRLEVEKSEKY